VSARSSWGAPGSLPAVRARPRRRGRGSSPVSCRRKAGASGSSTPGYISLAATSGAGAPSCSTTSSPGATRRVVLAAFRRPPGTISPPAGGRSTRPPCSTRSDGRNVAQRAASVLRHQLLCLLSVLDGFVGLAGLERLVTLVVLRLGLAEVLALRLRLLDLREEVLLELGSALGPRGRRQREPEQDQSGCPHGPALPVTGSGAQDPGAGGLRYERTSGKIVRVSHRDGYRLARLMRWVVVG